MNKQKIAELRAGLETGFINSGYNSSLAYQPQFLSNNHKEGKKVLSSIEDELMSCDKFQISVAFITMGGITPLLQTLKELEKNGIPGEILTTNYLNFSEPKALEKLHGLSNITLKMYDVEKAAEGFHTKGYIFKKEEIYRIIIGSSNMTSAALTSNREWNTKVVSTEQGEVAKQIVEEYNELWNSRYALSFDNFYEEYKERYQIIKRQREIAKSEEIPSIEKYRLKPNAMQVGFITNLRKILFGVAIIYVTFTIYNQQKTLNEYSKNTENLNQQIASEQDTNNELNKKKDDVNSLDFIEEMAREKLDMYYPNEKVYMDQGM